VVYGDSCKTISLTFFLPIGRLSCPRTLLIEVKNLMLNAINRHLRQNVSAIERVKMASLGKLCFKTSNLMFQMPYD
jgi:hypothetical protein